MKKTHLLSLLCLASLLTLSQAAAKAKKITLASPFAPLVMPMAYIVENGLLDDVAEKTELIIWNSHEQVRAMITKGSADFVSVPSNVAAIFYNKGVNLKMIDISIWGVMYIVSSTPQVNSLADLKGQTLYVPFRGDQPDLSLQTVARSQGFDLLKDFNVQYVSSPLDITMGLLGSKIKNALLIEPVASMVIMKGKSKGLTFKRVVDIQKQLGKIPGWQNGFPNAGVIALPTVLKKPEIVDAFAKAYAQAVQWTVKNPVQAAELAAKYVPGVNAAAFAESLKYTNLQAVHSGAAKAEIETMFNAFLQLNPKSIGEKLPDSGFYYP